MNMFARTVAAIVVAVLVFVLFAFAVVKEAEGRTSAKIINAKHRYYHADGYLKAIGKNARRTIYHPDPHIKHKWQAAARYLVQVRHKAWLVLHPPKPAVGPEWLIQDFLCIHTYEGSWTDTGAPYWGGLQFGWDEWKRFGGRYATTADQATPMQQIAAAIAYWRVSGFNPWPQTARMCGLL